MHVSNSKHGFSIVELMIVLVITGVLAAVAVPIYQKNVESAKRTEAIAGISLVKESLEIYYGTNGQYPTAPAFLKVVGKGWNELAKGDLTGQYFVGKNYKYRCTDGVNYEIMCLKNNILEFNVVLDWAGNWDFDDDQDVDPEA
ncbi:MAG: prepilin-type N-terminal cleavage/methylation domain-containing protein [Candidatus Marinimicrobia bacterium]|nr:prepilin-type N-terminal cleavage/methylation domain-containing protein [Candidatus Neomarinimicrobiota bacterium]MCF7905230.1 prepilin-type N-terminal cleavage/methylation domain-containing protein [Candidatus Neomarinimicrobiota bacterium]